MLLSIGFWGILYVTVIRNPQKENGSDLGSYSRPAEGLSFMEATLLLMT